jgi:putative MATE family efflux protein
MSTAKPKAMVEGNVALQIFLFTLPIMAGNFLQQLYNTVDGIVVGQFVSEAALAAVGTSSPVTVLYIAMAVGLSTGSGIIVAQYFGAGKEKDLKDAVCTSMIMLLVLGIIFAVIGYLITWPLMKYVLAVPEAELSMAVLYLQIYCIGLVFQFVYNIIAAILRALGDSKATLYFLMVSSVANIVLDLVFVAGFHMGVAGAALATVIAQGMSALVSIIYMYKKYEVLRFTRETMVFSKEKCMLALRLGIPTTLQQCVISGGNILLQRLVNSFGVEFMAGYTAGTRLESYLVIPSLGFTVGLANFTGQNIGAGRFDRIKEGVRKTLLMSFSSCVVLVALALIFRTPLVALFGVKGEALQMGITYLLLASPCFLLFSVYQAACGVLQGAGDVMWTMFFSLSSLAARVAIAYAIASKVGYRSLPYAMLIAWIYVVIIAWLRYRNGKWKEKAIVSVAENE